MRTISASGALSSYLANKKLVQLKELARHCGQASSGTKSELVERLRRHVDIVSRRQQPLPASIVSVDVGYRNLALVQLTAHNHIQRWHRHDLQVNNYDPIEYAYAIKEFIEACVEPSVADGAGAIVVERQRFRTMGSATVLENTLRSNAIEAMLWSALITRLTQWVQAHGTDVEVHSVSPKVVASHFEYDDLGEGDAHMEGASGHAHQLFATAEDVQGLGEFKSSTYRKKRIAERIVKRWLNGSALVVDAKTKRYFEEEKKQDDLSDCLLQAVAWYQWRHNTLHLCNIGRQHGS